jgi:hypothetical protein
MLGFSSKKVKILPAQSMKLEGYVKNLWNIYQTNLQENPYELLREEQT